MSDLYKELESVIRKHTPIIYEEDIENLASDLYKRLVVYKNEVRMG